MLVIFTYPEGVNDNCGNPLMTVRHFPKSMKGLKANGRRPIQAYITLSDVRRVGDDKIYPDDYVHFIKGIEYSLDPLHGKILYSHKTLEDKINKMRKELE